MRCTDLSCRGVDTRLAERTCHLIFREGRVVSYHVTEYWFCATCQNIFRPGVVRSVPSIVRYSKPPRPGARTTCKTVSKAEIIRELFRV